MRIRMLALVVGCMISGTATAQEWTPFTEIPREQLPISLLLSGWESGDWMSKPAISHGKRTDGIPEALRHATYIEKDGYYGYLTHLETSAWRNWGDTTILSLLTRFDEFRGLDLEYGDNGSVGNGAADFKYLLVSYKKHGTERTCFGYRGVWRTFATYGYLCSAEVPVTAGTAETFLRSIRTGPSNSPVAGTLPTKG